MPNHFAVQILCRMHCDADTDLSTLAEVNLCEEILPMPSEVKGEVPGINSPWYTWAMDNWGTKWGIYRTSAQRVPGDNFSVVWVSFECAWNPPKRKMMRKIFELLDKKYKLSPEFVLYFEPCDETYRIEIVERACRQR